MPTAHPGQAPLPTTPAGAGLQQLVDAAEASARAGLALDQLVDVLLASAIDGGAHSP